MPALSTAMQNAAQARVNQPFFMVYLDVAGDPVWAWSGRVPLQANVSTDPILSTTRTFIGAGDIAAISGMTHASDGSVQTMTLTLGNADFSDASALSFVNTEANWSRRLAVVWLGFVDVTTGLMVANPVRLFTGRMTNVSCSDGVQPSIVVKLAAKSAYDGQRRSGWKLADGHQKTFFAGDAALIFIPQMVGKELRFGVKNNVERGTGGAISTNNAERGGGGTKLT